MRSLAVGTRSAVQASSSNRDLARSPSLSFPAPLPGARVTFSCVAKRKSPKRRPPRCHAFRPSMAEQSVRSGRACRRAIHGAAASGRNPLRPPCGPDRPARTAAQGPRGRASCARIGRSGLQPLAANEAREGRSRSRALRCALARRRASQRQAGARRACPSTGMCEFAPARLAREAQGSRNNRRLLRSSCRAHGLSPLSAVTERGSRAVGARNRFSEKGSFAT